MEWMVGGGGYAAHVGSGLVLVTEELSRHKRGRGASIKSLHNQGLWTHVFWFSKRVVEASPFLPSSTHKSVTEFASVSLNISKYPWKCLNKLFWLCQGSKRAWSSYMFDRILKMPQFLNKPGFWIRMARLYMQGLRRVPNIFDKGSICLNNA